MIPARRRAHVVFALAIVAIATALAVTIGALERRQLPQPAQADKPVLLLLTSLPLLFAEDFSLEQNGSAALTALQKRYRIVPISVTEPAELAKGRLLLMAQPLAQPAEDLVALDDWVRKGGRILLLADPMLEWPSDKPLGDLTRPPTMFADTGLLNHWGLKLDAPDERGPVLLGGGHNPVLYISPGRLVANDSRCRLSRADIVADCDIGRGRAIVVADADMLNGDVTGGAKNPAPGNMSELLQMLDGLALSESR